MAQLVASASGVVLGGVAEVVGSNLARGKIFTASIGSVGSLYPSIYIYIFVGWGWLRTKFSCKVHHRLQQTIVTTASPKPLSRAGMAWQMCCDFTFTLSP